MALIVQKFGGTSVADSEKILSAARKAIRAHQNGDQVVVVVSAMGKNTDHLIALAHEVNEHPSAREMDMLLATGEQVSVALMAMAIASLGYKAVSLTGAQIGIHTDSSHTKARIRSISTERVRKLLDEGNIVIAAGFQGIDENYDITTLGRGGSDTTAVALAAVLGAETCEIYTDVDGVYTTDPRVLPEARLTRQVSYDEMLELASLGASVMHNRSIEFGKKFNVPIHVRSSFSDRLGSLIVAEPEAPDQAVSGAALTKNEARISLLDVPDVPQACFQIFAPVAAEKITVDMIVQNPATDGLSNLSFTVPRDEYEQTLAIIRPRIEELGARLGDCSDSVSKVSVVGLGMAHQVGVAKRMFRCLANAGIDIQMITTSEIKISVLVDRSQALQALRSVHEEFSLDKRPETAITNPFEHLKANRQVSSPAEVISRLRGIDMEAITIHGVTLDDTQSRLTLPRLPNRAGVAAKVFESLAEQGVFVDMILQSWFNADSSDLSFTVPRSQYPLAREIAEKLADELGLLAIKGKELIAKLAVSGIGFSSHTGMAIGMFEALMQAQIPIEMLNTSEVRVNLIVDGSLGRAALNCLQQRFRSELS
ncbi:MAG: aspartate kinase [Planctomycetota bacterium]